MKIANVELESRDLVNGKCLELINCRGAELSGSTLTCISPGSDAAPYPARSLYHRIRIVLIMETQLVHRDWRSGEIVAIRDVPAGRVFKAWPDPQSTHRVATAAFWRTFHHDGKFCPS